MTATSAARPRLVYPLVGVIAAIVGGPMMGVSFVAVSSTFLTGGDPSGNLPPQIVFWVGTVLVLIGLVLGIVGLVARRQRVLSAVTIVIALYPTVGLVMLVGPYLLLEILAVG
jgi:hypothetical protein